jgi:hypothetical protein
MKYMLALNILRGRLTPITVTAISDAATAKAFVSKVKGVSNKMEFLSTKYNIAGVANYANKEDQYLILNSDVESQISVDVLAAAFNMEKAEFMGHVVLVDGFGELDTERLDALFGNESDYHEFTEAELTALNAIPGIIVDRDFFMIFDNMVKFTEQYNGEGLYWNYWYHVWKIFSISPYANQAVFVPGTPSITSVTVSPDTATAMAGQSVALAVTVVTANYAPQTVVWTVEGNATVDVSGVVTINADAEADDTITVTATSTFDSTKSDTATITVV